MINRIKKYLNIILEQIRAEFPILINPSIYEVKKLIFESRRTYGDWEIRFVERGENLIIGEGNDYIHLDLSSEYDIPLKSVIKGYLKRDGTYFVYLDDAFEDITGIDKYKVGESEIRKAITKLKSYSLMKSLISEVKIPKVFMDESVKVKTPILIDPSLSEIKKKLYESKRLHGHTPSSLRFIIWRRTTLDNKSEFGYYVADAEEWVHGQIKEEMKIPPTTNYVFGELTDDGYLWFYRYQLYDYFNITNSDRVFHTPKEVIDLFEKTEFYKVVKPIVSKIEYL